MKKLFVDNGLEEYQLVEGGELLRFNPKDQNVYARFMDSIEKIKAMENNMAAKYNGIDRSKQDSGEKTLMLLRETDSKIKEILNQVFGHGNDFDKILRGVNLLAIGSNGKRVIHNLMDALMPVMEDGAKACVQDEVQKAKANREERRAHQ